VLFQKLHLSVKKYIAFSLKSGYTQIHEATSRQIPLHTCWSLLSETSTSRCNQKSRLFHGMKFTNMQWHFHLQSTCRMTNLNNERVERGGFGEGWEQKSWTSLLCDQPHANSEMNSPPPSNLKTKDMITFYLTRTNTPDRESDCRVCINDGRKYVTRGNTTLS